MKKSLSKLPAPLVALALGLTSVAAVADHDEIEWDDAFLFFELNNTDGDLGIHALIDGEPWKKLEIEDTNEREILDVSVKGRLRRQGLTEIFFESAEPTFDELSPEKFFKRFPEGTYEIEGMSLEGQEIESDVELTHLIPAPPETEVNGKEQAEDCDAANFPEVSGDLIISWEDVTMSHPDLGRTNEPIEVENYQLVVEFEEGELSFILPDGVTEVEIDDDLVVELSGVEEEPDGVLVKYEVLVREASYNQTATESCFVYLGDGS